MFEWSEEEKKVDFSPQPLLDAAGRAGGAGDAGPARPSCAYQYDIVCNGYELCSGAIRNHKAEIMLKAFEIAGYDASVVEDQFGGMLNAFRYGAPPHGGLAPGIDRIVMLLANQIGHPRGHRLPAEPAGPGPADERAGRGAGASVQGTAHPRGPAAEGLIGPLASMKKAAVRGRRPLSSVAGVGDHDVAHPGRDRRRGRRRRGRGATRIAATPRQTRAVRPPRQAGRGVAAGPPDLLLRQAARAATGRRRGCRCGSSRRPGSRRRRSCRRSGGRRSASASRNDAFRKSPFDRLDIEISASRKFAPRALTLARVVAFISARRQVGAGQDRAVHIGADQLGARQIGAGRCGPEPGSRPWPRRRTGWRW